MKIWLTILFLFWFKIYAGAQSLDEYQRTQDQIHTFYLYNFTRYFVWPTPPEQTFVIGVMGEHSIVKELTTMANTRTVGGKPISIRIYQNPQEIDPECHIVFIPHENSYWLSEILSVTRERPSLIVSSKPGLGQFGSLLNFVAERGKIIFEINEEAIKSRQLKFIQQLKAIGHIL
ncbi:MAG: YfiR family protein [Cyclobacteriaceae bacterium]